MKSRRRVDQGNRLGVISRERSWKVLWGPTLQSRSARVQNDQGENASRFFSGSVSTLTTRVLYLNHAEASESQSQSQSQSRSGETRAAKSQERPNQNTDRSAWLDSLCQITIALRSPCFSHGPVEPLVLPQVCSPKADAEKAYFAEHLLYFTKHHVVIRALTRY